MKKPPSLILAMLSFGIIFTSSIALKGHTNFQEVKADEQIVQTFAYDQMVILSSSISGGDITNDNSDPNLLIDYGFRHGDVSKDNLQSFDITATNRLGVEGSLGAAFLNWKMQTANGDGAIIKFTANKKVTFSVSREKLGNDWKDTINLSIYKGNTLLESKDLVDGITTADDFSYSCVLEKDETLYWQILSSATDAPRLIAMGNAGDYSTLPVFTVSEYVEYPKSESTFNTLVENYITANQTALKDNSNLFTYSFQYGNIENNSLNAATIADNSIKLGDSTLKNTGIVAFAANSNIILRIKAEDNLKIVADWNENSEVYAGISVKYFLKGSKTKLGYSSGEITTQNLNNLSKNCVINIGNELIIQILNNTNSNKQNLNLLESISFEQIPSNSSLKSDYPIYAATDFTNSTSITHKELAFETAKLACSPIKLKDGSISLLTGEVSETNGEILKKFDTIKYDDGKYLYNQNVNPSLTLAGPKGTFNSDDQAVVEDYRLQTSVSEGVVYKFVASVDTQLKVTHPAIDGGWVGGQIYIAGWQYNQKVYKNIEKNYIEENAGGSTFPINADAYAITYNLKAGDTAYYIFGSDMALRRNLNIAPVFTTSSDDYSSAAREEIFGPTVVEAFLYQTVTDTINNNYEPVTYEDVLTIGLYHGSAEDKQVFSKHSGNGSGNENDAIYASNGVDSDAGFQRWQFHAGLANDNAIMEFKAERDLELNITHAPMVLFYNQGASLRYYIADIDGFIEYKEERYLSNDTPKDFYGYKTSLKEGQSLIIEFTANDPEGYAVASIEWVATANPKNFDINNTNDFTDARALQAFKDGLVLDMENYVEALSETDYSISNYALIEQYRDEFISDIKTLTDRNEIQSLYDETIAKIDAVLTIQEEEARLNQARENAIEEARQYILARKSTYTADEWKVVLDEFEMFKMSVEIETSVTEINLKLITFKNTIDALPATQNQVIITIIVIIVCVVIFAPALIPPIVIAIKKRKIKKVLTGK